MLIPYFNGPFTGGGAGGAGGAGVGGAGAGGAGGAGQAAKNGTTATINARQTLTTRSLFLFIYTSFRVLIFPVFL